jgi:uncharacterized protein
MTWKMPRESRYLMGRRSRRFPITSGISAIWFVVLIVLYMVLAGSPALQRRQGPAGASSSTSSMPPMPGGRVGGGTGFVSRVFADSSRTWSQVFAGMGLRYEEPTLVLFSGVVHSACGFAEPAVGPFYCPHDHRVYIDLDFCEDLRTRSEAPGDFAQAYVIAHEVGHHVQKLLGTSDRIRARQRLVSVSEANALSVRFELQADCLAGIWAYHADRRSHLLGQSGFKEALGAASAIGDDRIQSASLGYVMPDSFSHGTSAQRAFWFQRGYRSGILDSCDTFTAMSP